ncbi:MAG: hypothetical protein ACK2T6_07365, partial [Anaerolineae bacterium]
MYSSLPDGSDLMLAAAFPLTYERGELREPQVYVIPAFRLEWLPWVDGYRSLNPGWTLAAWPMPMLSDIEFTHDGDMVIGLRDRQIDVVIPIGVAGRRYGVGIGDIVLGRRDGAGWDVTALPEHFDDDLTVADENGQGGLAVLPEDDIVVSGAWGIGFQWPEEGETGALWYDNAGGGKLRHEKVCGFRREPQLVAPALADNEISRA